MPGPLPNPNRRRRNAATIPTSELVPRAGRAPKAPYELREAGAAWWAWAWRLPQATKWDAGALYVVARRAQLEDDIRALQDADTLDLAELLGVDDDCKAARTLEFLIRRLKALAGGRVAVMREMRELDNRLGLNPKALVELRWSIAGSAPERALASVAPLPVKDPRGAA